MEPTKKNIGKMLTKIGIVCCLGPFIGDIKCLEYILVLLSKPTQQFYYLHQKALIENDRVSYPNRMKVRELLKRFKIDYYPNLSNGEYILKIDYRSEEHKQFVNHTKDIILFTMKKLAISWIRDANSQDLVNLNQFLSFSAPRFLQSLYLYGDSVNLEVLLPSLPALLKKVRKQVYIFTMEINEAAFV